MYSQCNTFRTNHGLQSTPGNVFANIAKETIELREEIEAENELGIICELADHVIYPINIIEAMGHDAKSNIERLNRVDSPILDHNDLTPSMAVSCIMMALSNWNLQKDIKALALIARVALKTIDSMGYHAEQCVLEKCKTINSRKGSYDTKQDKWCKDESQCPTTIYKPHYALCKKEPLSST